MIAKRREDLLVKWICLTIAVDVFDPHIIINLPAARLTGLFLLPSSIAALPAVRQSRAGRALCLYLIYLACMGLIFGFIFPWSSEGFDRLPSQMAQGRAIIYLIRRTADVSLAFFLARYLWKTKDPDQLMRWFVGGTSIAALGGILQWLTQIDLYSLLTGADLMVLEARVRGFDYEPRGLGLVACHGFLFALLFYSRSRSFRWLALVLLHAVALFVSVSTSGLFALGAGFVALVLIDAPCRKVVFAPILAILVLSGVLVVSGVAANFMNSWSSNVGLRLEEKQGSASESALEDVALRLDIFDASALMLFAARPALLLTGVGPGLAGLASTDYLPAANVFEWVFDQGAGVNSPPQMGLLREACDVGIVGLVLGIIFLSASDRALSILSSGVGPIAQSWRIARAAFWTATAIYLVQASPLSASLSVFLGVGLAATWLATNRTTETHGITDHAGLLPQQSPC
jgi:hypothetical protein